LINPSTLDLVRGNPYIDDILIDDRLGRNRGVWGALRLARKIRQGRFDTVFIMHTKRRYNLACFLAGIPCRVGYKDSKFGWLLTRPVPDVRSLGTRHEVHNCLCLLKELGIEDPDIDLFVPMQKPAEEWASQWLTENGIRPGHLIAIHAGASDSTKMWPAENFAELIKCLSTRYDLKVVLIGGPDTMPLAASIMKATGGQVLDLTGRTSVGQTASLLRRCRLLVSNDSGPVHIGAGVGIYVISLFLRNQPGINPARWAPLGPKSFVLANKAGEEVHLRQDGTVRAGRADSIGVNQVLELIERIFTADNQTLFYW
jgi:heptosyltransferase II